MMRTIPIALLICAALAGCEPSKEDSQAVASPSEDAQLETLDTEALADIETSDVAGVSE